jgi:hypothetical protein
LNQLFIRVNISFVFLELEAWQSGGCPITYFSIEHRLDENGSGDWIIFSNNIIPQVYY